jgi:hypothetical protein
VRAGVTITPACRRARPTAAPVASPPAAPPPERPARVRTYAEEDPAEWYGLVSAPLWVAWVQTPRGWEANASGDNHAALGELVRSRYGAACRVVVLPMGMRPGEGVGREAGRGREQATCKHRHELQDCPPVCRRIC